MIFSKAVEMHSLSSQQCPHTAPLKFETQLYVFIFTVGRTVHTNPSQHRSFSKTLLKPEEFENAAFRLSDDGKRFETALLENNNVTIIT